MWVDELLSILWASRTTSKTAMGESPFSLAFETKVVLPPKVVFLTPRIENFEKGTSKKASTQLRSHGRVKSRRTPSGPGLQKNCCKTLQLKGVPMTDQAGRLGPMKG